MDKAVFSINTMLFIRLYTVRKGMGLFFFRPGYFSNIKRNIEILVLVSDYIHFLIFNFSIFTSLFSIKEKLPNINNL